MILLSPLPDSKRCLVSLLFVSALALGTLSCTDKESNEALSGEVAEKQERFESLKRDLTDKNEEIRRISEKISDLESASRSLQRLQKQELEVTKEFNDLKKYEEEVKAALAILEANLKAWRDATRASLVGTALGVVDLGGGKVLDNPVVVEVLDDSVRLQNQGVETVVKLSELPTEIRAVFVDESLVLQSLQIEQTQK